MPKLKENYVVNARGRRTAVILPIAEFEAIMQENQDLRDAQYVDKAEASAEGFVELRNRALECPPTYKNNHR